MANVLDGKSVGGSGLSKAADIDVEAEEVVDGHARCCFREAALISSC